MILYIENSKDPTKKLLEIINTYGKVSGFKICAQKSKNPLPSYILTVTFQKKK